VNIWILVPIAVFLDNLDHFINYDVKWSWSFVTVEFFLKTFFSDKCAFNEYQNVIYCLTSYLAIYGFLNSAGYERV